MAKAPTASLPDRPWYDRLNVLNVTFLIFLIGVVYSVTHIDGSGRSIDYWAQFQFFATAFFPPDFSAMTLVETVEALGETVKIALISTFLAILTSFVLALGAAQNIAPKWMVLSVRMLLNLIRSIPSLVWAVIAVMMVGANPLAGVVALTFYSIGYLGKFFSEDFESVNTNVAQGLRAMGADPIQSFQYGMWPKAKPLIWSHSLWMLEYNIRSASIIGYVGAGGIGAQLHAYQEYHQWESFSTVLLFILGVVVCLDLLGEYIRKKLSLSPDNETLSS